MLRPVRTLILVLVAGAVGYLVALERVNDACVTAGGTPDGTLCRGID